VGAATLAAPAPAAGPARATPDVLVVGDSLARGVTPYLAADLGQSVAWDVRAGRPTPDGLRALRAALAGLRPRTVVLSLGTNDSQDALRFARRVRTALAMVPASSCVVWSTIFRPRRKGRFAGLNHVLRLAAARDPRLVLVDWNGAVARGVVPLRPDGLHPLAAGYRYRSLLFAAAVRRGCPALGGLAAPRI
jgi:lysophospholipase L1-like esterase